MIYTVLDNIIIIILTGIGLFTGETPELLLMVAGFLMVLKTYETFDEDKSMIFYIFEIILMAFFAVLSGGAVGFIVFFLFKSAREYIRIIIGVSLYIVAVLVIYKNTVFALCIVETLLLLISFLFLIFIYYMVERIEKRRQWEVEKLTAVIVSEMHERRLNERLVMQNFLVEKNARLVERENISRNIHNSVGHSITAAIMALDAADTLYDVRPEEARKRMNDAGERIRGSLGAIRRAVRILDEDNTEILSGDLKYEMEDIINEFQMDTNICVVQNFSCLMEDISISHEHAEFLTGVLKEMLTNGIKHGNASEFVVTLMGDTAHIRLEVTDNGHSDFNIQNSKIRIEKGFGIKKVISYVEKCGGKTAFVNDNGFRAMVELPIMFEI